MLKNVLCILVVILMFFLCGCEKETPMVLFNNQPINKTTVSYPVNIFELGETTHFVVFNPKGFESPYLRLQIIKKSSKTQNWGYGIAVSRDVKVDTSKKYYIDSVNLSKSGTYLFALFYLDDLNRPIVRGMFTVK